MDIQGLLERLKPFLIIVLLFSVVFYIRAEASNIGGVPADAKKFYEDADGLPYFSEMDSYYNYRLTMNYLTKGIMGDTLVDGKPYDLHSYYPPGRPVDYPPLIVYVTSAAYRVLNFFGDFSLKEVAFWMGAFIGSLCVIPAYLFVRRITNDYGGFAAALIVGLVPTYVAHTYAGFFDTDMFNFVLPLFVFWFFTEGMLASSMRGKVGYALAAAVSILVFSAAWVGYIFYLAVLIVFVAAYLVISRYILGEKPEGEFEGKLDWLIHQRELFPLLILLIAGGVLIGVFGGFSSLAGAVGGLIGATQIQATAQTTAYPNVYVSVSELQVPEFITTGAGNIFLPGQNTIVGGVGGLLVFIIGVLGVGALVWKYRQPEVVVEESENRPRAGKKSKFMRKKRAAVASEEMRHRYLLYAVLMAVWLIMSGYAVTKGSRFIPTFAMPLGLSAGIFTGFLVEYLRVRFTTTSSLALIVFVAAVAMVMPFGVSVAVKLLAGVLAAGFIYSVKKPEIRAPFMMVLVVLAAVAPSVSGAHSITTSVAPGTDDGMWNSMQWVKKNTSRDTVVMSWWDFGHLFAVAADRPVTFDGGSQNTPRAYWIGKALTTSNETLSRGILTMLSTSGDLAYETLDNYTDDSGKTAEILTATLGLPREEARAVMTGRYGLSDTEADSVLRYSHPAKPKPFVLVLSSDMLGKAPWWTYFGTWDFKKKTGSRYGYYPSLASSKPQVVNNTTVIQTVNTMVDQNNVLGTIIEKKANTTNATIAVGNNMTVQKINPHKLTIIEGDLLVKNEVVDSDAQLSLIVIGSGNQYTTIIMNRELEDSVFTKLFLLGGFNQTSFKFLHQEPGVLLWTAA
ncbi:MULTISPECIES: dolichyl-diphosphooligosaccharide--protein glycosyltransferase subunit STT3 [unclassified Methanothermobacter]|jgi:dolichyl-diphosphooligosaccharide--protein glycosyltransferase|uniref:dolichyl-phosphooligosaccharide-protein glycotransferase n=1 Tax=Methanothermobacter thermautotrophicus TaxID=145262 RepID=A0A7J4MXV0_METTF|nr:MULTISPECIES: STT3 domain-containing protein [unclassified Methanothermobacter]BAZ99618.1 Undecaprenyl-diphosphooligosaccharide--protein glycotransferase [Methanothermobacter sp. EMTCatA1]HIH65551.1 peptide transporter [Methanothermobacter thermautotrophicus]HIH70461.1 peptide transporter [Methanothermobacter thermautotrophicus]